MDRRERERLQAVAYGPDSDPTAAASAARMLASVRPATDPTPDPESDPEPESEPADGADAPPILQTGPGSDPGSASPDGRAGARPARRWRPAVVVAAVAVVAFGLGAGATTWAARTPTSPTAGPTSSASELTVLARVLGRDQSPGDRVPTALRAGVVPSTSRLVFSNAADRPRTPWSAWIAATSDGDLCVLASPNGTDLTRSCIARSIAFDGTTSLVARSSSDTLTVLVADGVVDVELTGPD